MFILKTWSVYRGKRYFTHDFVKEGNRSLLFKCYSLGDNFLCNFMKNPPSQKWQSVKIRQNCTKSSFLALTEQLMKKIPFVWSCLKIQWHRNHRLYITNFWKRLPKYFYLNIFRRRDIFSFSIKWKFILFFSCESLINHNYSQI